MKILITIVAVLIGLLSIAAGAAKIALIPEEVAFLGQFGFTKNLTFAFGAAQVLGGVLLMSPITRLYGSLVAGIAFAVSAALLLIAENVAFAGVSMVPVILAGLVAYQSYATKPAIGRSEEDG